MPRRLLKRFIPEHDTLKNHKHLKVFGVLHLNPNLWHLSRNSVALAFSIGLFTAFVPLPFQMVLAAAVAILLQANLPISVVLVWITNPITIPPILYFAFQLGNFLLRDPLASLPGQASWQWFTQNLSELWQPLFLGLLVCGLVSSLVGNIFIRLVWRVWVGIKWKQRKKRVNP